MNNIFECQHTDCMYHDIILSFVMCDYILKTGHPRGCPANECTHYKKGKRNFGKVTRYKRPKPKTTGVIVNNRKYATKPYKFSSDSLRELLADGLTDIEIAARFNCTRTTVRTRREALRLPPNRKQTGGLKWDKLNPQLTKLYKEGLYDEQIAMALGISKSSVQRWRTWNGLEPVTKKGNVNDDI